MHDMIESHWHEPRGTNKAGYGTFRRPALPYDTFMEEQGIPIFRDIGVSKVQNLPLKPWKRMGGNGTFIQLYGTEGLWGSYVIEVPASGALNVEKHIYEEQFLVIEGRGSTEIWQDGGEKTVFEWQAGSMFAIPVNANHRIVNSTNAPALLLAGTSAPNTMNLFGNEQFIFNNPFVFREHFDGQPDYYKSKDDIAPDPVRGLAMRKTNFIPDIVNCELPLDNRRSPGYRRVEPHMANNRFYVWIGQHENGRYAKAHAHASAAVLICVKGKGYTYTWPASAGQKPWESGKADLVKRVDYEPVGMVTAAPMNGDWFHQHFGVSHEPLRLTAWFGPNNARGHKAGVPGQATKDLGAMDIRDGGSAIPYDEEDPYIRKEYEETLRQNGTVSRMEDWLYTKPKEGEERASIFTGGM
ncbi:MAG TPA: cupin domain-containing protein [Paracoccus sp. (in: a-proteobacteria)]|uniref:cupin domain-containing protein n=1 Tax=Paracoccus sp. TaxID=267 RepID=UPI002B62322E|nr:cupin domain-containing protein [Paracoccus sp. (in: a-proteobacteria)]HWL57295.1 cupin domain-containing protein [Paracoccus sp. (in: a-proteobacteria)]